MLESTTTFLFWYFTPVSGRDIRSIIFLIFLDLKVWVPVPNSLKSIVLIPDKASLLLTVNEKDASLFFRIK